jgi:hypothetical protein
MKDVEVCQECGSQDLSALTTLGSGCCAIWCARCEYYCKVEYITEEELKVRQVVYRLKGVSV